VVTPMQTGDRRKCPGCGTEVEVTEQRKRHRHYRCGECTALALRASAEKNKAKRRERAPSLDAKHRAEHPEKVAARWALNRAVRRGDVIRKPCEACGALKVHGHHDDYSKPLEVRWLCRTHHERLHHA
jgi:endogenous inhibitor of DNA gyrase (YacG/DUF329 family)